MAIIDSKLGLKSDHIDMRNRDVDPFLVYMTGVNIVHRFKDRKDQYHTDTPLIITAGDTRKDSEHLLNEYSAGIRNTGGRVICLGHDLPKPILYLAGKLAGADAVGYISSSHSSSDFNGVKYDLLDMYGKRKIDLSVDREVAIDIYMNFLEARFEGIGTGRKIAIDPLNGSFQGIAKLAYEKAGYEVISCHDEIDREFSKLYENSPDPHKAKNLEEIMKRCIENNCIGASFDGDGDRLAIIDNKGIKLSEDEVTMLIAKSVIENSQMRPGAKTDRIVYEIKSSNAVPDLIRSLGGIPIMERTGSTNIRKKMFEIEAVFAGEVSGHNYYNKDRVYPVIGGDDGLFTSLLINELLIGSGSGLDEMIKEFPRYAVSDEKRETYDAIKNKEVISNILRHFNSPCHNIINLQGDLRIEKSYKNNVSSDGERQKVNGNKGWGWFVIRNSNNDPDKLTIRIEGNDPDCYYKIRKELVDSIPKEHQELRDMIEKIEYKK